MHISMNWLGRHVDLEDVDLDGLIDRFILSVAEIEDVSRVGRHLDGVCLGHVLDVAPIEGARIQKTTVDLGALGHRQIVCGAPNVAAGQWVPVATVGTRLGDLEIAEREVRGVLSSGMIASESELGLGEDQDGIMVFSDAEVEGFTAGTPLCQVFDLEDTLFEIDNKSLTHRPDLWGHRGIAREVGALLGRPLKPLDLAVTHTGDQPLDIRVEVPEGCPAYTAVCMDNITVARAPFWMRLLLHRVGTRAVSNVVDLTNFVMLDLGNPLHAFDRREVQGKSITIRAALPDENFTTLDGQDRSLEASDIVIADAQRPVALAGIMGGQNSEIRDDTTAIVLEAANFDAATVRMTSQRLGLRTDSSARFEKSLDPALAEQASLAFCKMLLALDPNARVTSAMLSVSEPSPKPIRIRLHTSRAERRLGAEIGHERIIEILERLDFQVTRLEADALDVVVPSFRATKDVSIEADLVEEIGRFYGYDNIVPVGSPTILTRPEKNARKRFERRVRNHMSVRSGFDELMTYSFAHDPFLEKIDGITANRITLKNPISAEMPALRTCLVPNLLWMLERNSRRCDHIRIYEMGRVFIPNATPGPGQLPSQPVRLSGLIAHKSNEDDKDWFRILKGVLEGLAPAIGRAVLRTASRLGASLSERHVAPLRGHPTSRSGP